MLKKGQLTKEQVTNLWAEVNFTPKKIRSKRIKFQF